MSSVAEVGLSANHLYTMCDICNAIVMELRADGNELPPFDADHPTEGKWHTIRFKEDLGMCSVEVMDLGFRIEQRLGVRVDYFGPLKTPGDMYCALVTGRSHGTQGNT
jgi:hypothetical protein